MKRDLDLVRKILAAMEATDRGFYARTPEIDGYTAEEIGYHAHLMAEAGFITAVDATDMSSGSPNAIPMALTWAGHDFLDSIKDDSIWNKAKEVAIKPMAGLAFEVLKEWLKQEAKSRLGIS